MRDPNSKLKRPTGQGLLIAIFGIAAVHNFLFLYQNIGLNYLIFTILLVGFALQLSLIRAKRTPPLRVGLAGLSVVFASFVAVNASSVLTFFNVAASLALLGLVVISVLPGNLRKTSFIRLMLEYLLIPFYSLVALFQYRIYDRKKRREYSLSDRSAAIIRGIVITIPIALVFILLLAAADSVFANIFSFQIPSFDISGELISRLFIFALVSTALVGVTKHILYTKKESLSSTELSASKSARTEMTILLTVLNTIFLLFIAVQIVYLFGGRQVVLDNGLTFAEYARRGFFELVFVAALAHVVVAISDRLIKKESGKSRLAVYLQLGLIIQVFVVIISALKRLRLYQDTFGFTTSRFYAYTIMFCIAAAFVALTWKIISNKNSAWLTPRYGVIILVALFSLNMIVPDRFVAQQNIDRFKTTGKLDVDYIFSLSADAADEQLEVANASAVFSGLGITYTTKPGCNTKLPEGWRSYNLSKEHSRELYASNKCMTTN